MQLAVPAHFAGPIPHAHDAFDEAIYVLRGHLLLAGDDQPQEAPAGSMFVAPAGSGAPSATPHGTVAWVLGIWAPAGPAQPDGGTYPERLLPGPPAERVVAVLGSSPIARVAAQGALEPSDLGGCIPAAAAAVP